MSIISSAYAAIITRIETELDIPAQPYFRLANPYKPEENNDRFLKQGYAVAMNGSSNTERFMNCKFSVARSFSIILTRQYFALEPNAVAKSDTELLLFEDQYKLIKSFETDVTVNDQTMQTTYESDDGIEYVSGTTDRFLMLRTTFTLEYLETFN